MATTAATETREVEVRLPEICRQLEHRIQQAGSLTTAAAAMGVSPQYLSAVLKGEKLPGPLFMKVLGLKKRRITIYTRTEAA